MRRALASRPPPPAVRLRSPGPQPLPRPWTATGRAVSRNRLAPSAGFSSPQDQVRGYS